MVQHKVEIVTLRDHGGGKGLRALADEIKATCDRATEELGWGLVTTIAVDPKSVGLTDPPAILLVFAEGR